MKLSSKIMLVVLFMGLVACSSDDNQVAVTPTKKPEPGPEPVKKELTADEKMLDLIDRFFKFNNDRSAEKMHIQYAKARKIKPSDALKFLKQTPVDAGVRYALNGNDYLTALYADYLGTPFFGESTARNFHPVDQGVTSEEELEALINKPFSAYSYKDNAKYFSKEEVTPVLNFHDQGVVERAIADLAEKGWARLGFIVYPVFKENLRKWLAKPERVKTLCESKLAPAAKNWMELDKISEFGERVPFLEKILKVMIAHYEEKVISHEAQEFLTNRTARRFVEYKRRYTKQEVIDEINQGDHDEEIGGKENRSVAIELIELGVYVRPLFKNTSFYVRRRAEGGEELAKAYYDCFKFLQSQFFSN